MKLRARWAAALGGVLAAVMVFGAAGAAGAAVSGLAAIPASYLTWYREAARTCPGLAWEVLAGIGTIESGNGQSTARGVRRGQNRKGAEGPMQFEPATFAEYAVRADPARKLSPYDPRDAIFTAARMLCADGGGSARRLKSATFAYNHARWYVRDVLALAASYTAAARRPLGSKHDRRHRRRAAAHGPAAGRAGQGGRTVRRHHRAPHHHARRA